MNDQLIRAVSRDGQIKAAAVSTRVLTERARQIHKTLPVATAALGRLLAAASMMGNALKEDGASLTLQIKGGGPLGTLLAVSDNLGNVRGTVDRPVSTCLCGKTENWTLAPPSAAPEPLPLSGTCT